MRGKIGRMVRTQEMGGNLGSIDWGGILDSVVQAAPAIYTAVSSTVSPTTTQTGTGVYYPTQTAPQPTVINQTAPTTDYTPWLIGGALGIGALVLLTRKK